MVEPVDQLELRVKDLYRTILLMNDERVRVSFLEKDAHGQPKLRQRVIEPWMNRAEKPQHETRNPLHPALAPRFERGAGEGPGAGVDGKYDFVGKSILMDPFKPQGNTSTTVQKRPWESWLSTSPQK